MKDTGKTTQQSSVKICAVSSSWQIMIMTVTKLLLTQTISQAILKDGTQSIQQHNGVIWRQLRFIRIHTAKDKQLYDYRDNDICLDVHNRYLESNCWTRSKFTENRVPGYVELTVKRIKWEIQAIPTTLSAFIAFTCVR